MTQVARSPIPFTTSSSPGVRNMVSPARSRRRMLSKSFRSARPNYQPSRRLQFIFERFAGQMIRSRPRCWA